MNPFLHCLQGLRRSGRKALPGAGNGQWETLLAKLPVGIGFCGADMKIELANQAFHTWHAKGMAAQPGLYALRAGTVLGKLVDTAILQDGEAAGRLPYGGNATDVRVFPIVKGRLCAIVCIPIMCISEGPGVEPPQPNTINAERLGRLVHELSNPLNSMVGWLHLIESQRISSAELPTTIRKIQSDARRQGQLLNELRELARSAKAPLSSPEQDRTR